MPLKKKIYCKGIIGDFEISESESNLNNLEPEIEEPVVDEATQTGTTPAAPGTPPAGQHPTIPGLSLSKTEEKKLKQKKKGNDGREEDDFVWSSLKTHPVFNAQKGANGTSKEDVEKKRNAAKANLSPQDKNLLAKSRNLKSK